MKREILAIVMLAGLAVNGWGGVVTNWVDEAGFEGLSGATHPDAGTAPWFTSGESDSGWVQREQTIVNSGSQSIKISEAGNAQVVQDLGLTLDSNTVYEMSFALRMDDLSSDAALSNDTSVGVLFSTSETLDGSYTWSGKSIYNQKPSTTGVWETVTLLIDGADPNLADNHGEYLRVALKKWNKNSEYTTYIDDVKFGPKLPRTEDNRHPVTFYVDAVNGDDSNDGMSHVTPWQTPQAVYKFDDFNGFVPGDKILFRRGDTFSGSFRIQASGEEGKPIVIGAYGDEQAAKPWIQGTSKHVIQLNDGNSFIEISDLKITNYQPSGALWLRYGIEIAPPEASGLMEHIYITNCDIMDVEGNNGDPNDDNDHRSYGIYAQIPNTPDTTPLSRWHDFRVENCHFEGIDGWGVRVRDHCNMLSQVRRGEALNGEFQSTGLVIQNNTATNNHQTCIQFNGQDGALIQNNVLDGTGGDSSIWFWSCRNTTVQYNVIKNINKPAADAYALHGDFMCENTLFQYNVGVNCEGGLVQAINQSDGGVNIQNNLTARYNLGIDCGFRSGNSAAIMLSGDVNNTKIYNNTIITTGSKPMYKAISFGNWTDPDYGGSDIWPENSLIANNIFYSYGGKKPTYKDAARMDDDGNVVTHNMYVGPNAPDVCPAELHEVTGDPRFADATGSEPEDFKVAYNSDVIGAGLVIADNGGEDFFGTPLTNATPSIGFYEFIAGAYTDTDGDLMSDAYEIANGLDPDVNDAHLDKDGDGRSNLDEFIEDTLADDPNSRFIANVLAATQELDWDEKPERLYHIFQALSLGDTWNLVQSNAVPPFSIDTSGDQNFYKVEVEYELP